ncbi:MAG TPA: hypothetical protein VMT93_07785 [Gemmatimonadaceae bacterium]|nr:hypothetical protein [Gemmatimonadaceae bacterium]
MAQRPRSPRHEYDTYVELEVEHYKNRVPRQTLLAIGDEAVKALEAQAQFALTELLLCAEVDRIIMKRIGIESYAAWRKKQTKMLAEYRKPEKWGMAADDALVRTARSTAEGHVLLAGANEEGPALYLAANGIDVTTLDPDEEILERVYCAAAAVGLTGRIRALASDLANWSPDGPINAVVCAAAAFAGLSDGERRRAIALLQSATIAGGVHMVETSAHGTRLFPIDELRAVYRGWQVSVERGGTSTETFLATKLIA